MIRKFLLRTLLSLLFLVALGAVTRLFAVEPSWPLRGTIDFSDGFGDFRDGRFHAGVDLRTGGHIGAQVFAPVDGYVYRLKTSYVGYGKGLYIKGSDNCLYVFGHLLNYSPAIDSLVKAIQFAAERYAIDTIFSSGGLTVKKGDLIAYSGQTGTTAPHLHFEKRISDENPVNPLTHGFSVDDKVAPTLTRLGFAMVDNHSLFANGQRTWFVNLHPGKKSGSFVIDSIPFFSESFGVLLDGFDRTRPDGMNQAIAKIRLEVDGQPVYESRLDTLAFSAGKSVYFEYSYEEALKKKRDVRRLYHATPNNNPGSRALNGANGIIEAERITPGKHIGRITAEDCFGNVSTLEFAFLTAPQTSLLRADSAITIGTDTTRNFFSPRPDLAALQIDSLVVEYDAKGVWRNAPATSVTELPDGSRMVETTLSKGRLATMRMRYYSGFGCTFAGEPFYGLFNKGAKKLEMEQQAVEGGMIVTLKSDSPIGSQVLLKLFGPSGLLAELRPYRHLNLTEYRVFIPVDPKFAVIDSIAAYVDTTRLQRPAQVVTGHIRAVGYAETDTLAVDSLFQMIVRKSDLPQPTFVELQMSALRAYPQYRVITNGYRILPSDFPTLSNLEMRLKLDLPNVNNYRSGICDFDAEQNKWKWLPDSHSEKNVVTASCSGGGTFAVKLDVKPPVIYNMNIQARQRVVRARPVFEFNVVDSLSGIGDDKSFDIRLDRKWMIPEFDPNLGICTFAPPADLADGDHHLAIKVTDRAGNLAEQYLIFTVAANTTTGKK